MKKALVKNKKNYATFMFIPENRSAVKSYRIPAWFPIFTAISVILLVFISATCFSTLSALKLQYEISKKEVEQLTAINSAQQAKLENLQKNSEEVQKKLEENSQLLEEVKKAVGITSTGKSSGNKPATPKDSASAGLLKQKANPDMSKKIASIESDFASLADKIALQKKAINESIDPIKGKLAYLMAKPSIMPVNASMSAAFGYRRNPFTSRGSEFHSGIDFAASYGQTVSATGNGIVIFSGWNAGYGKMVIISHGYGITTSYAHNSKLLVKQGEKVKKGQAIAKSGNTGRSTGAHLHYEVKLNGKSVNPEKYFN